MPEFRSGRICSTTILKPFIVSSGLEVEKAYPTASEVMHGVKSLASVLKTAKTKAKLLKR